MPIVNGRMTIEPKDIPTPAGGHFWNAFGNSETEISARWLVRFAKKRGQGWEPFNLEDIEKFYNEGGFQNFCFNNLLDNQWILVLPMGTVVHEGGVLPETRYHFTEEFIARCYKAATK